MGSGSGLKIASSLSHLCRMNRMTNKLRPCLLRSNRTSWHSSYNTNVVPNYKALWISTDTTAKESEGSSDVTKSKTAKRTTRNKLNSETSDTPRTTKARKAYTIKRLNKENKDLFGDLLETKQEKVKRTKKELKSVKGNYENFDTNGGESRRKDKGSLLLEDAAADIDKDSKDEYDGKSNLEKGRSKANLLHVGWLPRGESIKFEHAGMSINKEPIKDVGQDNMMTGRSSSGVTFKAHKGAEIKWSLKYAPTKMKLIDYEVASSTSSAKSSSSSSTSISSEQRQVLATPSPSRKNILPATRCSAVKEEIISFRFNSDTAVKMPSVTKILSATMPEEQAKILKRWEEKMIAKMGEEGFRIYKEGIFSNGKMLHGNIEAYLRGTPVDEISVAEPNKGHWSSLSGVLQSVEHVYALESHVTHPELQYCGVIDCVAEFRNRLVLIDWKTSQKPKPSISMTYDTPLQIAAYIGAVNGDARYSMKIDSGLIVVAYEDGSHCQTFLLSSKDVDRYWNLWVKRLELFRQMNPAM